MKANTPKKTVATIANDPTKSIKKDIVEPKTITDKIKEYSLLAVVIIWAAIMWYYMFK